MKIIMYCIIFCCMAACSSAAGGMNIFCCTDEQPDRQDGQKIEVWPEAKNAGAAR